MRMIKKYVKKEIYLLEKDKKILIILIYKTNQPTIFRTKNWVEINDDARGMYNTDNQIKFKTSMSRPSLCDYSEAFILGIYTGTITVAALAACGGNNNIQVVSKNCAPFTSCISEINITQKDYAKDIHVVMPMFNLIECSDNY